MGSRKPTALTHRPSLSSHGARAGMGMPFENQEPQQLRCPLFGEKWSGCVHREIQERKAPRATCCDACLEAS